VWDRKNLKILDTDDQLICQIPELDEDERLSWNLSSCCLSRSQMVNLSQTDGQEKLSMWGVSDPMRVTRLKSQYFKLDLPSEFGSPMKMDEHFIAISTFQNETTRFYFFTNKTLKLHWRKEGV
jgi:hypothetical protein